MPPRKPDPEGEAKPFKPPETPLEFWLMLVTSRNGRLLFNATYRSALGLIVGLTWNDGRQTWAAIQTIPALTTRIERIEKALAAKGILSAQISIVPPILEP